MISLKIRPLSEFFSAKSILFALWLFLLVFPKGGFKIGGVPITWGYLLLAIASLVILFHNRFRITLPRAQALMFLLPFQVISIFTLIFSGVQSVGFTLSFALGFIFLPYIFFLFLSPSIENLDLKFFTSLIKKGMLFISAYGIFLFFYKLKTGNLIEIPFLTVNYHDLGEVEDKCNDRGIIFKLISTYNNGNLFGIALLIFLPLYCYLENSTWRKLLVKSSLVLTFSRTVWVGLLFSELLSTLLLNKNKKLFWLKVLIIPTFFISLIIGAAIAIGLDTTFFLDRTLGGRADQIEMTKNFSFLSAKSFSGIIEIVYLGILQQFGLLGLLSYLAAMLGPIFLTFAHYKNISLLRRSLLCGLLSYLFISASDGALLLIPVLAFYWFCASLALRKELDLAA